MKTFFLSACVAATASALIGKAVKGPRTEVVKTVLPQIDYADLPTAFDWGNVDGVNYLTNIRQQHNPQYCGSCWAHAVTSAMSDRIKIARNAAWPDVNIAPQVLISCSQGSDEFGNLGCNGGYAIDSNKWIYDNYITDETCSIYQGRGWTNGEGCSAMSMCRNCNPGEACYIPPTYKIYELEEYGGVSGEANMMNEIYARGPIACAVADPQGLIDYTYGIFYDTTGRTSEDHEISVVGWGEENGVKYWRVRNSWGSHWGDEGFFKVVRGVNNIGIEQDCDWAVPKDTWTADVKHTTTTAEQEDPNNDQTVYPFPQPEYVAPSDNTDFLQGSTGCRVPKAHFTNGPKNPPHIASNDVVPVADLPTNVDWRDMDGRNFLSWNKNQHIPQYCGSCWAQGTTSSIADRFNILTNNLNPTPIGLNAQVIVNCYAGGSCNGGDPAAVYEYAYNNGIPDSSCEQYIAYNLQTECTDYDLCKDCAPPVPAAGESGLEGCAAVNHKKYYVSSYYNLVGAAAMKSDLAQFGPISCGIQATDEFELYTSGIYSQVLETIEINHEIAVVGYGVTSSGQEYWIGRNSWGTYWGEYGFFKMQMYTDNLGIEQDCTAGIPTFNPNLDAVTGNNRPEFIQA